MQMIRVLIENNCPIIELNDGSRYPVVDMVWSRHAVECRGPDPNSRYFEQSAEITISIKYSPTFEVL